MTMVMEALFEIEYLKSLLLHPVCSKYVGWVEADDSAVCEGSKEEEIGAILGEGRRNSDNDSKSCCCDAKIMRTAQFYDHCCGRGRCHRNRY